MTEESTVQTVESRRAIILLGVPALGIVAVAVAVGILDRSPTWDGPVFALVTACVIAGVPAFTRTWRDRATQVAAVGLLLVAGGSGIGRPPVLRTHSTTPDQGTVIGRLDTWWVVVAIGLALLVLAAAVGVLRSSRRPTSGLLAVSSLLTVGVGYAVAAVAMPERVVTLWISGRPLRDPRRRSRRPRNVARCNDPADLWHDAAEDEAEAVAAFGVLAGRLAGVGAPESLVRRCREAALEERRHAAVCTFLAGRLGSGPGTRQSPTRSPRIPKPETGAARHGGRTFEILRLATESFVDGIVGEGFAARRLEAGSTTLDDDQGSRLRSMALEERRHAALGADIVAWALHEHPALVRGALWRCANRLPLHTEIPDCHRTFSPAELASVGMVDQTAAEELWRQERTTALARLEGLLTQR